MAWLECVHPQRRAKKDHRLLKVVTTLGRTPGNDVLLDDPDVAPSHATLVRQGAAWTITALDKSAWIRLNGQRTRSAPVVPGDELEIGGWRLLFREGEPVPEVPVDEAPQLGMLEQLVQLSADLMRETSPERLFHTLLQGLVRLTRAEKGFVIVLRDGERQLAASHNVGPERLDLSRISDSIVDRVVDTLQPVIVSDALHDTRFGRSQSVVDLRLSSVMCVPLIHQNDLLGVIYLGNDAVQDLFTERDLTVLRIYAAQASIGVHHALLLNQLRVDNEVLRKQLGKGEAEIVGASVPMKEIWKVVRRVAPTDLSVLVLGETGTGKELVARELHVRSERAAGPFVAINCGAIPENLLESELFGHRKGAFTGADADKIGKIEAASGGTLFLDEIGEMPMHLQVKLLRVLQERQIERVGDISPRPVDIRVIAATNRDPREMIVEGGFREDLFYRLHEVSLTLPPLRDRGEDVVLLAQHFLHKYGERYAGKARGFTNQALLALKAHDWPGNVRQLENHVKKAVILSDRALLNAEDLGIGDTTKRLVVPLAEAQEQFKVDYIRRILDLNGWNKAQTARDLGVDARTIFRYIEKIQEGG